MPDEVVKVDARLLRLRGMSMVDKVLYSHLRHRQGGNSYAWPAITTIMRDLAQSRNTILKSLARLETDGLVTIERANVLVEGGGPGHSNKYIVTDLDQWFAQRGVDGAQSALSQAGGDGAQNELSLGGDGSLLKRRRCAERTVDGAHLEPKERFFPVKREKESLRISLPVFFELLWNKYPEKRRGSRQQAVNAWNAALVERDGRSSADAMITALDEWLKSTDWEDPTFIPYLGSYIANGKWLETPKNFSSRLPILSGAGRVAGNGHR